MKCRSETQETQKERSGQERGKCSSYEKPELWALGNLRALIRGGGGSLDDGAEGNTLDPD